MRGWSAQIPNWASSFWHRQRRSTCAGDTRAGDNLYLCSVVALEIKTGKLRWYYQTIRHDIWEADIAESPVLFDAQVGGRVRKAVAPRCAPMAISSCSIARPASR